MTTHHETATRLAYERRNSLTHVQLAEALRDLTAQVGELVEVVHKMAVLLAERETQTPASEPKP